MDSIRKYIDLVEGDMLEAASPKDKLVEDQPNNFPEGATEDDAEVDPDEGAELPSAKLI